MTKINIKIEKIFIDAWSTNINNTIYIKIIKDMSLIVTFVSVTNLTKKKHYILYKCQYLLKRLT